VSTVYDNGYGKIYIPGATVKLFKGSTQIGTAKVSSAASTTTQQLVGLVKFTNLDPGSGYVCKVTRTGYTNAESAAFTLGGSAVEIYKDVQMECQIIPGEVLGDNCNPYFLEGTMDNLINAYPAASEVVLKIRLREIDMLNAFTTPQNGPLLAFLIEYINASASIGNKKVILDFSESSAGPFNSAVSSPQNNTGLVDTHITKIIFPHGAYRNSGPGVYTFANLQKLETLIFPGGGAMYISPSQFSNCPGLTKIFSGGEYKNHWSSGNPAIFSGAGSSLALIAENFTSYNSAKTPGGFSNTRTINGAAEYAILSQYGMIADRQ
jgi:hypothetical protein